MDQPGKDNPLYELDRRSLNTTANLRASGTLYKYLNYEGDPRLSSIYGSGVSNAQGDYSEFFTATNLAKISIAVVNATDPVYFMSQAESYFLQAEAVAKGWGTGDDHALYDAGVEASFAKFGISNTKASKFLSIIGKDTGAYLYPVDSSFEQKQKAIIMQKWIAMAGSQGIESFFETNRTHYPPTAPDSVQYVIGAANTNYQDWNGGELMYSVGGVTGGQFPKRLLFPSIERQVNANTPAEVPIITKVWWDKK
jgi:hypothetical protein